MRSSGLRRVGCSRGISRKPVTLPIIHLGCAYQRRHRDWRAIDGFCPFDTEHTLVFVRKDLDEVGASGGPVLQNPGGARTAGKIAMALEQSANEGDVLLAVQGF